MEQVTYALSLVSAPVFSAVMQQYIDDNGIEEEVTRENCAEILHDLLGLRRNVLPRHGARRRIKITFDIII